MFLLRLIILILSGVFISGAYGQTSIINQLKSKIGQSKSSEEKIGYVFRLCEENQSMSTEEYRQYVSLATTLSNTINNDYYKDLASAENAFLMAKDQQIDSALAIVNSLLKKYENKGRRDFITKLLTLKGRVLDRGFRRIDNIDVNLIKLQECERYEDTLCLVMAMNSMGWSYLELGKNEEALIWLRRALLLNYSNTLALRRYNCLYSNTALAFYRMGKQDSAEYYIKVAIKFGRETETLTFLSNSLSFQAQMLMRTHRSDIAKASLNEALTIRKQLGDPYYIIFNLLELAGLYAFEKDYQKSIELCKEGIAMAYHSGSTTKLPEIYQLLADNYEATSNQVENIKVLRQLIFIKDSLNNVYNTSLGDIETKYEVQKKENVIMKQQFDLTTKNYFLFGSTILLLVVIAAAFFIFRENRRRHKLKMEVMLKEEKRTAAMAVTEAEEGERQRIAADLHDNLGAQANAILYSTEKLQEKKDQEEQLVTHLHHTAKDMITSLRETLWALKNADVTAAAIWIRLINFCQQISRHYPLIKISTDGVAPQQFHLTSTRALNIVFILQEAVNNAVRHSSASTICIHSSFSNNQWTLRVKDDGNGFDETAANEKPESYGLNNMKERALAAELQITIRTSLNEGTDIEVMVPVKFDYPKGVLE